jgi:hypothetical protein
MQKGKSEDPLSTWLPIKEFVSKIDKLKWSWRLKTPCIYIVRKTAMLVITLNLSFLGIVK